MADAWSDYGFLHTFFELKIRKKWCAVCKHKQATDVLSKGGKVAIIE
jgi:hypothetical protein